MNSVAETMDSSPDTWWEDGTDTEEADDLAIGEYDITSTPNDFNIITIFSFIESGAVTIPGFQRNYVWDIKRASKLIESIIIGLPVPPLFLYEEARNKFLVIDGQQRLMSIYYFMKGRFPRNERRTELRRLLDSSGKLGDEILQDDGYFVDFNLHLPAKLPNRPNKFDGLNYQTLGEYRTAFDMRTIRNVIVKQIQPKDNGSAIYEIFNRLNSGGVNLTPQEIRMSLYHSPFYDMLIRLNTEKRWRELLGLAHPDLHMKDAELVLRGFAMLINGDSYNPSMVKFLNAFSRQAQDFSRNEVIYLERLFGSFLASTEQLGSRAFFGARHRFSVLLFEAVFAAVCGGAYAQRVPVSGSITPASLDQLKADEDFQRAADRHTTAKANVSTRLNRARQVITIDQAG